MAGIGFRLEKLFGKGDLLSTAKGCIYSVVISSGPWLITIVSIAFISLYAQGNLDEHNRLLLKAIISYSFAIALIFFGAIEMPITRYLADKLYLEDISTLRPLYFTILFVIILLGGAGSYLFYIDLPRSLFFKVSTTALYTSIFTVWVAMVFLGAAKRYTQIVVGFLVGGFASALLSIWGGQHYQLVGNIAGLALGQGILSIYLSIRVILEFQTRDQFSLEIVDYFMRYRRLIVIGISYYCAIWIDKFIYWFSSLGIHIEGPFYTNLYYDTSMFLAYLTIVPSLSFFLVRIETSFYQAYRNYFSVIEYKATLAVIDQASADMVDALRKSVMPLFKLQTFVTVITIFFTPELIDLFHLPVMMVPIFRYGVLGAYLQALFLLCNIILLYFQCQKSVLINYLTFFGSNLFFSWWLIDYPFYYHGMGFLASSALTFFISIWSLNYQLRNINALTFMGQPMVSGNV